MKNKIISKQTTIKIKIVENKDSHFSNCVANKKLKKFVQKQNFRRVQRNPKESFFRGKKSFFKEII